MDWLAQYGLEIAAIVTGLATATAAWTLLTAAMVKRQTPSSRYEQQRRQQLRATSYCFRRFEPIVDELAQSLFSKPRPASSRLALALKRDSQIAAWTIADFYATKTLEASFVALAISGFLAALGYALLGGVVGVVLLLSYPWLAARSCVSESDRQLQLQRRRLPFVVDQIALMMGAGANFEDCLRAVVSDEQRHPLIQQLAIVVDDIEAGKTRRDALLDFQNRLPDRDVRELVFAITTGEELGTPLSSILADQAEQMRLKRSQWGEKAAAEAEVQIVFPGMLVMLACLIVIVGPILLPVIFDVFGQER